MGAETTLTTLHNLKLYKPDPYINGQEPQHPQTPSEWFIKRYKRQYELYGSPFLELNNRISEFSDQVLPVSINIDFFAAVLGGRGDLGHKVVYYEPEMCWYYKDSDNVYKPTTSDKIANQYRALMIKSAQAMPQTVYILNLFQEFRSDKTAKAVVNRAKSVLAADSAYFGVNSKHQRIKGQELHERILRKFVDELLTSEPGKILMLHDAYAAFSSLLKQRGLAILKRSDFKAVVVPYIKDEFNVALRNDLVVDGKSGQRGWKNVSLQSLPT